MGVVLLNLSNRTEHRVSIDTLFLYIDTYSIIDLMIKVRWQDSNCVQQSESRKCLIRINLGYHVLEGLERPYKKKTNNIRCSSSCHIVPGYLTFIDDYLKILDFIKWLKVAYPEKAVFLTEET